MKTVLVTGVFNVLHPGHIRLFRFAKECGDKLIVAVKSGEVANQEMYVEENLRLEVVESNAYVDKAFLSSETIEELVQRLKPDVLVKGREHENDNNPEEKILKKLGGELIFDSGDITFSSLDLLEKELHGKAECKKLPPDYMDRHDITGLKLINYLNNFSELRVTVIGDLIMDEYITCDPIGMSQEDPTVVVTPIDQQLFIGGAGIVAAHASGLGATVNFISVVGDDQMHHHAEEKLIENSVNKYLIKDTHRPTTLKQRYRCKGSTLLRVSHLHQSDISKELQDELICRLEEIIRKTDLLVFSDFNYGVLPERVINKIIEIANKNKVYTVADSQSSSQIGDISRYKSLNMLTPTEREARIAMKDYNSGLVVLAESLRKETNTENILLKLGEDGVIIHSKSSAEGFLTDRLQAMNDNPKDVAGAGDSMLITSAMTLCVGGTIWDGALLGSVAAGLQVGRLGNQPLQLKDLYQRVAH